MKTYHDRHGVLPSINLHPLPLRPLLTERVLRADREVLAVNKSKLYSNYASNSGVYMGFPRYLVEALTKLGVFNKRQLTTWQEAEALREKSSVVRQSASTLGQNMKVLGIKPTKAQQAKLDAILGNMTKERAS